MFSIAIISATIILVAEFIAAVKLKEVGDDDLSLVLICIAPIILSIFAALISFILCP